MITIAPALLLRSYVSSVKKEAALKKYEKSKIDNPSKYKKSSVDVNNPPDEVREAAADMGFSVEDYKEKYLNRPTICEIMNEFYKECVEHFHGNVSKCSSFQKTTEMKYNCSKFEEKYSAQSAKY